MNQSTDTSFVIWFIFVICLLGCLIFQSSFLSFMLKPAFIPYVLWPPLLFFSCTGAVWFLLFYCLLSVFYLVFCYLCQCLSYFLFIYFFFAGVVFIKKLFFPKSFIFFVGLVFVCSFFFPYFVERAYGLSVFNFSLSNIFILFL